MKVPKTEKWKQLAPLPRASGGIAGTANSNSIFGGEYFSNASGVYKKVSQYLPIQNVWKHISDMPVPRHGLGA